MRVRHESLGELTLPDFLLVGAAKSATTSLYYYLNQHPGICMTSIKESWFFSFLGNPPRYSSPGVLGSLVSDLTQYVKLFDGARYGQKLGDASPSYLYTHADTIHNIRTLYPGRNLEKLRIIISLRDPASRAYSQYWTFRRFVQEPLSFEDAIDEDEIKRRLSSNWNIFYDYTGFGRYYDQVRAYREAFGSNRVLILLYEDIQLDPVGVCQEIFRFIDVDRTFVPNTGMKHNDITGEPRNKTLLRLLTSKHPLKRVITRIIKRIVLFLFPEEQARWTVERLARRIFRHRRMEMAPETRARLRRLFDEDVRKLEVLIERDLSHWRS